MRKKRKAKNDNSLFPKSRKFKEFTTSILLNPRGNLLLCYLQKDREEKCITFFRPQSRESPGNCGKGIRGEKKIGKKEGDRSPSPSVRLSSSKTAATVLEREESPFWVARGQKEEEKVCFKTPSYFFFHDRGRRDRGKGLEISLRPKSPPSFPSFPIPTSGEKRKRRRGLLLLPHCRE